MKVRTDFEVKHFVEYTKMRGGTAEILASKDGHYVVDYDGDIYKVSHDALNRIKLLNQNLIVKNRIIQ